MWELITCKDLKIALLTDECMASSYTKAGIETKKLIKADSIKQSAISYLLYTLLWCVIKHGKKIR